MHPLRSAYLALLAILASGVLTGCLDSSQSRIDDQGARSSQFKWDVPAFIPLPVEPADNPMTESKFQLGRHLFYDERLSANGNIACATCHHQDKAFTDGLAHPAGTYGDLHPRNAQPLGNTAWYATFNWAAPLVTTLEEQIRGPLFGTEPPEHGIAAENQDQILATIIADKTYQQLFIQAFPEWSEATDWSFDEHIIPALASFIRGISSFDTPFDHYLAGNKNALSNAAVRGFSLFMDERLECTHCHFGDQFLTNNRMDRSRRWAEPNFHNTGAVQNYLQPNQGVYEVTGKPSDLGLFRTPSLRNIALTAPYSHDGSHATLRDIIETYSQGGKGAPNLDGFIIGFTLTAAETNDLIAFLCSLTDETFITNPRYSNPWPDHNGNPRPSLMMTDEVSARLAMQCN